MLIVQTTHPTTCFELRSSAEHIEKTMLPRGSHTFGLGLLSWHMQLKTTEISSFWFDGVKIDNILDVAGLQTQLVGNY